MRKIFLGSGLMGLMLAMVALTGCPGPGGGSPDNSSTGETVKSRGNLSLSISGVIPQASSGRALLGVQRIRVQLTDPQGQILPEEIFHVSPGESANVLLEGLLPGAGYKVDLGLFNLVVSDLQPQVIGTGIADIRAGETAEITIVCLPLQFTELTSSSSPWAIFLAEGGEVWGRMPVLPEGLYQVSTAGDEIVRIFDGGGKLLGEAHSGSPYLYGPTEAGVVFLGVYSLQSLTTQVNLEVSFPSPQDGSPAEPLELIPAPIFRKFALGALGSGNETSWYKFTLNSSGIWWLDLPYSSDFRWDLSTLTDPGTVLSSGTNTTGLKFEGLTQGDYLLVLKNLKSTSNLKINGRLLTPELCISQGNQEGSPEAPVILPGDGSVNLKMGGSNFDNQSWYAFTCPSSGWQQFIFGEAGVGSYNGELYKGNFSGLPLVTWSNLENTTQEIKLVPGETYALKVAGVFSSGIKPCLWPLQLRSLPLPGFTDLTLEDLHTLNQPPGASAWYRFSVTPGKWYLVKWDDKTQGSGVFTGDVRVSVYGKDRNTGIFYSKDKGYSTRWVVQALPGEDELFALVQGYSPTSTGTYSLQLALESGNLSVKVE